MQQRIIGKFLETCFCFPKYLLDSEGMRLNQEDIFVIKVIDIRVRIVIEYRVTGTTANSKLAFSNLPGALFGGTLTARLQSDGRSTAFCNAVLVELYPPKSTPVTSISHRTAETHIATSKNERPATAQGLQPAEKTSFVSTNAISERWVWETGMGGGSVEQS